MLFRCINFLKLVKEKYNSTKFQKFNEPFMYIYYKETFNKWNK